MTILRRSGLAAFLLGLATFGGGRAESAFVTYTETVVGSGTLGSSSFSNVLVTFTQTADTNNVISGFFTSVADLTSTVNVAGIGTASFTGTTFTAVQPGIGLGLGLGTAGVGGPIILATINPALFSYGLRSSIGPVTGTANVNAAMSFLTTLGTLRFTSTAATATFQANVVPEPSSLALCGVSGLLGLGYLKARRRMAGR